MALDIYVGPLTRFYTGRWKSIITQYREGFDPNCLVLDGGLDRLADLQVETPEGHVQIMETKVNRKYLSPLADAGQKIENWRQSLNEALAARLKEPLDWPEDNDGDYFTDKPGWEAYGALMLWAAHEEHPEFETPEILPEDWVADPAHELSLPEDSLTRYPTLLRCDFWLPGEYSFTSQGKAPNETDVTFGFSAALRDELVELNARTWCADEISGWLAYGKKREDGLEDCAKFAFAVFYALAGIANKYNQPMVLDW